MNTAINAQLIPAIHGRFSPMGFSDQSIDNQTLERPLEAFQWAASAFNEQPWRLIYAQKEDEAAFEKLLSLLVPGNHPWARTAPLLILTLVSERLTKTGGENHWALHDLGLALGNLTHQAFAEGLQLHHAAGFDAQKARETFNLPEEIRPVSIVGVGYPAPLEAVHPDLKARAQAERQRNPVESFAFLGH